MDVVCGERLRRAVGRSFFAWRVVKHGPRMRSWSLEDGQTLGIGAGQMSRVDAVRIAIEKARELGHSLEGAVLASDAFFPFADGPELALEAGIVALIQPGGSKRDAEVSARPSQPARRWSSRAAGTSGIERLELADAVARMNGAGADDSRVHPAETEVSVGLPIDEPRRGRPESRRELRAPGVWQVGHFEHGRSDLETRAGRQVLVLQVEIDIQLITGEWPAVAMAGDEVDHA